MSTRSGWKLGGRLAALAGALVLSASPALAGKATFGISPTAVEPFGDASSQGTLQLPGRSLSGLRFGFVLPEDYKRDTTFAVALNVSGIDTPCTIVLLPATLIRSRKRKVAEHDFGGSEMRNGGIVELNAFRVAAQGVLRIRPRTDFDQRAGDGFVIGINRDAGDVADTCGDIAISAISVRYRTE